MTSKRAFALATGLILLGTAGSALAQDDGDAQPVVISAQDVASEEPLWGQVVTDPDATAGLGADEYELEAAAVAGDTLAVTVSYGGGCEEHHFALDASAAFRESDPVQLAATLAHNANNDSCQRWVTQDYLFDLTPLKMRYHDEYQQDSGTIVVMLEGSADELLYEFVPTPTPVEDLSWGRVKGLLRGEDDPER